METIKQPTEQQTLERVSSELLLLEVRRALETILNGIRERLASIGADRPEELKSLRPEVVLKLGLDGVLKDKLGLIIKNEDLRLYMTLVIAPIMPASLIYVMHSKKPQEVLAIIRDIVEEIDTAPFYMEPKPPR